MPRAIVRCTKLPEPPKYYTPREQGKPEPKPRDVVPRAPRPNAWTQKEIDILREMREGKCTAAEIAERIGKSRGAVYAKMRRIEEKEGVSQSRSAKTSSRQNIMQGGAETEMNEMH